MLEVPSQFVISSRLSTLEAKEILEIIQFTAKIWNEKSVEQRMKRYPSIPIMGVGISNPQELQRVISGDIPVIHIQDNCEALQAVQKREIRNRHFYHRWLLLSSASIWGIWIGQLVKSMRLLKRGHDVIQVPLFEKGNLPIPNYMMGLCTLSVTCLLSWFTQRVHQKIRHEYAYFMDKKHMILVRNDVLYSKRRYFLQTVIPYCFIGLISAQPNRWKWAFSPKNK